MSPADFTLLLVFGMLGAWGASFFLKQLYDKIFHMWILGLLMLVIAGIGFLISGYSQWPRLMLGVVLTIQGNVFLLIDLKNHRNSGRGPFQHSKKCHMKKTLPPMEGMAA